MSGDESTVLWDREDDDERHEQLLRDGWQFQATKAFVERDLAGLEPVPPRTHGWHVDTLARVGDEQFAGVMQVAATGDPFDHTPPERAGEDLRELIDAAGSTFDPLHWYLIADEAGTFGVVLPQVYDDDPHTGTLFYLAVLPDRRSEGLGHKLHLWGLHELRARGAHRYVGSSDLRNAAMLRIFARNGAQQTRTQSFYFR